MDILSLSSCHFFEWSVPNNGLPVFTCHSLKCHPSLSGQKVTIIPNQYNGTPPFSPVKLHYPLAELDPFLNEYRYPIVVSRPSQNVFAILHSYCITSIHSILCKKWCTLYLSLFDHSNQRFHLQSLRTKNLNRGICHTPIFDLRRH